MSRRPATPAATTSILIRLDDSPRYQGSVHDDAVARRMGFRAALVPGAFLYGHISRLAVETWGREWIEHGAMAARFRKPVYNGDTVTLLTLQPTTAPDTQRFAVAMIGHDGDEVASGWIAMPEHAPVPPPADACPMLPLPLARRAIAPGGLAVGTRGGTPGAALSQDDVAISRAAFDEHHPIYTVENLIHSGCLMRRAMFDVNGSFAFPAPVVLVACEAQHFASVQPGQRLATSSIVTANYIRRGRHYFKSQEFLVADEAAVVARFHRTQIYATEPN